MKKHKFNIFPEMSGEEFSELVQNIDAHGFDPAMPVIIYEGSVLDGWNRYRAAEKLGVAYASEHFSGTPMEALDYVLRTNVRRNLSASVRGAVAAKADELIAAISAEVEAARRKKISESRSETCGNISTRLPELTYESDERQNNRPPERAKSYVAKQFGVNEKYVHQASKLRKDDPEAFESVVSGDISLPKAIKQVKERTAAAVLDTDEQDDITRISKEYGSQILKNLKELQTLVDKATNALGHAGTKPLYFLDCLSDANSIRTMQTYARRMTTFIKCPACQTKGCEYCRDAGYVEGANKAAILDRIDYVAKGGFTYEQAAAEGGGAVNA